MDVTRRGEEGYVWWWFGCTDIRQSMVSPGTMSHVITTFRRWPPVLAMTARTRRAGWSPGVWPGGGAGAG